MCLGEGDEAKVVDPEKGLTDEKCNKLNLAIFFKVRYLGLPNNDGLPDERVNKLR